MYVCLCKGITDSQIRRAVAAGVDRFSDLRRELDLASQCGKCGALAREVFHDARAEAAPAGALFYPATAVA